MTIDIRGTNSKNKGALLMLESVVERLGDRSSLSAPPQMSQYEVRARLGLKQTLHDYDRLRAGVIAGNRVPGAIKRRYGLVADKDITGVLDASGFAYSDSFSLKRLKREAWFGELWAKHGVPKVMLPQAFGPFEDQEKREASKRVLESARVVFARDDVSASYLEVLRLSTPIVRSPDFTIGVPAVPSDRPTPHAFGIIVPNMKVVSSKAMTEADYGSQLQSYAKALNDMGLEVVLLVHEDEDLTFAAKLSDGGRHTLFSHRDPRVLKAILGQAEVVVSSRFHALVGALSQNVPVVALGWSHKYRELLADFGVEDWLQFSSSSANEGVRGVISDTAGRSRLGERKLELQKDVRLMWDRTEAELGLKVV